MQPNDPDRDPLVSLPAVTARPVHRVLIGLGGLVAAGAVNRSIDGTGAVLQPPTAPDVRTEDAPNVRASLVDNGCLSIDCEVVVAGVGGLTSLIEDLPAPSYIATRPYILREVPGGSEQVVRALPRATSAVD